MQFRAKRLPRHPGPAAWNCLLPSPPPARELTAQKQADIAIVGAGFAGLSAARRLNQLDPNLRVAVIDASRIAEGPAGRNSGFMIDLPHDLSTDSYAGSLGEKDALDIKLNRRAIAFATEVAAAAKLGVDAFNPGGKINAASSKKGDQLNRDYAVHLDNLGEPCQMLNAAEMEDLTGISFYHSGLHTPGAVVLQPAAYIRALAKELNENSVVYENSPVVSFEQEGARWRLHCNKGSISAEKIILANNGHVESFGFFRGRLMHVFTFASMTEKFDSTLLGGELSWGVTAADPMGTTVRRIKDGDDSRIVVRTKFTLNPSMTASRSAVENAGAVHNKKFIQRFPMLKQVGMEYRWGGHLCASLNGVPAHGEVEKNVFSAACQNGLGAAKGTMSGISAAELAYGEPSEFSLALQSMDPPKKLLPEPIRSIGGNLVLRWREFFAGSE